MAYAGDRERVVELVVVVEPGGIAYEQPEHEGLGIPGKYLPRCLADEVSKVHRKAQEAPSVAADILRLPGEVGAQEYAARGVSVRRLAVFLQRGDELQRQLRHVARAQLRHDALVVIDRGLDARQALLLYAHLHGGISHVALRVVQHAGGDGELLPGQLRGGSDENVRVQPVPAQAEGRRDADYERTQPGRALERQRRKAQQQKPARAPVERGRAQKIMCNRRGPCKGERGANQLTHDAPARQSGRVCSPPKRRTAPRA